MIRDAASAVAASICWLARWRDGDAAVPTPRAVSQRVGIRHPAECDWCAYPAVELSRWVEEFRLVDEVKDGHGNVREHLLAAPFLALPGPAQVTLVDAALYSAGRPSIDPGGRSEDRELPPAQDRRASEFSPRQNPGPETRQLDELDAVLA